MAGKSVSEVHALVEKHDIPLCLKRENGEEVMILPQRLSDQDQDEEM